MIAVHSRSCPSWRLRAKLCDPGTLSELFEKLYERGSEHGKETVGDKGRGYPPLAPVLRYGSQWDQMSIRLLNFVRLLSITDETDPKFWEEVEGLGWSFFHHEELGTLERFGEWQTPLVDVVAQSLAAGFIGTADSTFSLVSGRRVEDWNDSSYQLLDS